MAFKAPEADKAYLRKYLAERQKVRIAGRRYRATDIGYAMGRASGSRCSARERGAVIDPELSSAILAQILRDQENCNWCATPIPSRDRIIDHKIAIVFGGQHTESNIQVICQDCDQLKSNAERSLASRLRNGATRADFALAA